MDENEDFDEVPENKQSDNAENKNSISADLIRGHINTIILRTLYERDKYGYEIIEEIEKKSHGQYTLKQPTLYSALKRLESQGYINAYWKTDEVSSGGRRKYYTLTESGREITEKNQSEWEYSRTVIDNLISDRSFDFSQPAPSAVDFKILKKSTSRVPVVKAEDDDEDKGAEKGESKPAEDTPEKQPSDSSTEQVIVQTVYNVLPSETSSTTESVTYDVPSSAAAQTTAEADKQPAQTDAAPGLNKSDLSDTQAQVKDDASIAENNTEEEQRRRVHENYLRLISTPVAEPKPVDEVPVADDIDTEKLVYNNKPEAERDYRNLINNLFIKTVRQNNQPEEAYRRRSYEEPVKTTRFEDVSVKAESDGLKVNTSEYVVSGRKKSYNRGGSLFKSSLIVAIVLMLVFVLSLIFKKNLGVSLAYPFVIFALAVAQLLIFAVLYYTDLGKITRKPSSSLYVTASIVITFIATIIIVIISLLIGTNFKSVGDVFAKLIIPLIVAFNIPIFTVSFYFFSK